MEIITRVDFFILNFLQKLLAFDFLDSIMLFITHTGDKGLIWIAIAVILAIYPKTRKIGFTMGLSLFLCLMITNVTLKPLIARERPFIVDPTIELKLHRPGGYSFPSGHTAASFAAAFAFYFSGVAIKCSNKYKIQSKRFDRNLKYISIALFTWAGLIGVSRMYFMVHFPTDIIGGILIGLLCGYISSVIVDFLIKRGRSKPLN